MKFFKGFLVFILIAIIVGGVGYIGYNIFMGGMDHSGVANSSQTQQTGDANSNANVSQNQQSTQQGSSNTQSQNNTQQSNSQIALNQSNTILQNKEKLDKSIALINESQRLMSVDPYAPSSNNSGNMSGMNNTQPQQQTGNTSVQQPVQSNTSAVTTPENNTTINIFPQGSTSTSQSVAQGSLMPSMGTTYDANKMEQLHAGLYKISVGKSLLDQLQSELIYQAEYANMNVQNPSQYYTNQYNLTVQDKNKLSQALTYVNEAANLVNINPYISANGLVYDKDRMNQIHQSILKLAEGVATLNQLGDDFTKQTVYLTSAFQNYINSVNTNTQQVDHSTMTTGLFGSVNMTTVVNIILILFAIGLIAGIFGFIFNLFKSQNKKNAYDENNVI